MDFNSKYTKRERQMIDPENPSNDYKLKESYYDRKRQIDYGSPEWFLMKYKEKLASSKFGYLFRVPTVEEVYQSNPDLDPNEHVKVLCDTFFGETWTHTKPIYEWNRGVIGINTDGEVAKVNLDGTKDNQAHATVSVVRDLNCEIEDTNYPFANGAIGAANGFVIVQTEWKFAFIYFPNIFTKEQLEKLREVVMPRDKFEFSFVHQGQVFEEYKSEDIMNYATKICTINKDSGKTHK